MIICCPCRNCEGPHEPYYSQYKWRIMDDMNHNRDMISKEENALALWLGAAVPRYTSYPPAPAFHANLGAADYEKALQALPPDQAISLYLHIPFCDSLCLYCGCHTTITHRQDRLRNYVDALQEEAHLLATKAGRKLKVGHLHCGGGTPNILSVPLMNELFDALEAHFDFSACKEKAVELDPRDLTEEKVAALAMRGVSRVSLGVQDFVPEVQALIHREQPYALVQDVCTWLRRHGIFNINFDLMYGLPRQTPESVAETARLTCALEPSRIALFSYAHLPRLKKHQKALEPYGIPDARLRLAMDEAARAAFLSAGYEAVGMDHFARPDDNLARAARTGTLRRNFQGYTDDAEEALIALGASSISQTSTGFFQNERDIAAYQKTIASGQLACNRGYLLQGEDPMRAVLIERLMCDLACDIAAIAARFDLPPSHFDKDIARLKAFEDAGLLLREGYVVRLTSPYRMAIRVIAHVFDTHTPALPSGFSRAA